MRDWTWIFEPPANDNAQTPAPDDAPSLAPRTPGRSVEGMYWLRVRRRAGGKRVLVLGRSRPSKRAAS
jgi:hypothetical protein